MSAITGMASPSAASISTPRRWVGRVLSALAVLFLLVDGVMKVLRATPSVETAVQLGYPAESTPGIGILLLVCLAIYLIPRTAPLGAILLTGFLGGVVTTHVRAGSPPFSIIFALIIGALLWLGLYLRDARLRVLLPL